MNVQRSSRLKLSESKFKLKKCVMVTDLTLSQDFFLFFIVKNRCGFVAPERLGVGPL